MLIDFDRPRHFGPGVIMSGSGASAPETSVPEPTSLWLVLLGLAMIAVLRRAA